MTLQGTLFVFSITTRHGTALFFVSDVCRWRVFIFVGWRPRWKWGLLPLVGGDMPLTSVIGAGGRSWLRFPCIRNYLKVFYPLPDLHRPSLLSIRPTLRDYDLSRLNESNYDFATDPPKTRAAGALRVRYWSHVSDLGVPKNYYFIKGR